jgi:hypothetical protein
MGFVLQFENFNLAFRVSNDLRALDAWVTALHRVLVFDSKPQQAAPLTLMHQGPLELVEGDQVRLQHFCLYADRLESYGNTADALAGRRCQWQVRIADVSGFKVLDHGFLINMTGKQGMELRVVGQEDLEVWLGVFRSVLATQSRNSSAAISTASAGTGTPMFGSVPKIDSAQQDGVDASNTAGGQTTPRSSAGGQAGPAALNLKLPHVPWPVPPHFEAELRRHLITVGGTSRAIPTEALSLSMKEVVTAEVTGSKEMLEELIKHKLVGMHVLGHTVSEAFLVGPDGLPMKKDVSPRITGHSVHRIAALSGHLIYEGQLGIQHGGQLSKKHFVLFKERLDYHDSKEDADAKKRPKGRIALCEVSSYEACGDGFILKLLGRSVGLHVGQDQDSAKKWMDALADALQGCTKSTATTRRAGALSKAQIAKAKAQSQRSQSAATMSNLQRAYGQNSSTGNLTEGAASGQSFPQAGLTQTLSQQSRRSVDAGSSASGSGVWNNDVKTEGRVRCSDGNHWIRESSEPTRINARDANATLRSRSSGEFTEKVTGDRSSSGIIQERRSLRHPSVGEKPDKPLGSLTPRTKRSIAFGTSTTPHAWEVTGKLHEEGRVSLKPTNRPDAVNFSDKVNSSSRDSSLILARGHGALPADPHRTVPSSSLLRDAAGVSVSSRMKRELQKSM